MKVILRIYREQERASSIRMHRDFLGEVMPRVWYTPVVLAGKKVDGKRHRLNIPALAYIPCKTDRNAVAAACLEFLKPFGFDVRVHHTDKPLLTSNR